VTEPTGSTTPEPRAARVVSLDALRGLAILMMCLSGLVPRWLPNWMYHGYYPQYLPGRGEDGGWGRVENPWAFWSGSAFTWVDWVFPMFLFAMGAAIPLAMRGKLSRGVPRWKLAIGVLIRGAVLIGFAVVAQQLTPWFISGDEPTAWDDHLLALLGFGLLFAVLMPLPKRWSGAARWGVRAAGLAAVVGLLAWVHVRRGTAFSWNDKDIIILLLAWMAVFAGLLWLAMPGRGWPVRLAVGLVIAYVAHHQAMKAEWRWFGEAFAWLMPVVNGWPKAVLDWRWVVDHPAMNLGVLWDFTWLKFLWVVLPGTVVGELLVKEGEHGEPGGGRVAWGVAGLQTAVIGVVLVAFWYRGDEQTQPWFQWFGGGDATRAWGVAAGGVAAAWGAVVLLWGRGDRLLWGLSLWAAIWLTLGWAVEPWEGGIKKGPPSTLSWYLISTGLSVSLLAVFVVMIDRSRRGRWWMGWLVLNGQNPMVAYVGIRNLLAPVVSLPLLGPVNAATEAIGHDSIEGVVQQDVLAAAIDDEPALRWAQLGWAIVKTLALAAAVAAMTRLRLIWRS
jgi:predicted acyltransferase